MAWLLADFISGVVHWWEDRAIIGVSRFAFINSVRADNERHHKQPGYFLKLTWWENINTTAPAAWALSTLLFLSHAPLILVLTFAFLGLGNLVHRWAHEPKSRLPRVIRAAQFIGLFASNFQHGQHHFLNGKVLSREESRRRYCVMSDWLNPALDRLKFFQALEWGLSHSTSKRF